jgi:hypothetical protein
MPICTSEQIIIYYWYRYYYYYYYCYYSNSWRHSAECEAVPMLVETHHLKSHIEANGGGH